MRFLIRLIAVCIFSLIASPSFAIGDWRVYHNYGTYDNMVYAHGLCYVLSTNHLFVVDMSEEGHPTADLTRLEGLNGSEIYDIKGCDILDILCIVYTDGNIDLIGADQTIVNVPDLKYKNVLGDKTIMGIHVQDTRLFVSTGFGFMTLDLENGAFINSMQTNSAVTLAFEFGDHIYYCSEQGTFLCKKSDLISVPSHWTQLSDQTFTRACIFEYEHTFQGWLVAPDQRLYYLSNDTTLVLFEDRSAYQRVFRSNDFLIATGGSGIYAINLKTRARSSNFTFAYARLRGLAHYSDSTLYMLNAQSGLMVAEIESYNSIGLFDLTLLQDSIGHQQVGSPRMGNLLYRDGVLTALTGGMESIDYSAASMAGMLSYFDTDRGLWTNVTSSMINPQLNGVNYFMGLNALAFDAANPDRIYAGGINRGVFHIEGDSLIEYLDYKNSPIPQWEGENMTRCTAIMADDDGSEWFACGGTPYNLTRLSAEGKWTKYQLCNGETMHSPQRIIRAKVDPYHLIWVVDNMTYETSKIAMLYDGGTPEDISDDATAYFRTMTDQDGNSLLPNYNYYDVAEDKNGAVWIMTASGPFVVDSQVETFNHPGKVRRPKIPRNDGTNLADYLMADVACTCIAIDAANRKWIGTLNNGLYLLSADGLTQLEHFTTENSPLPSDYIMALTMDEASGTVYISAEGGICSYTTDAVSGAKDYNAAYCYPNPVRPDFTGDLHVMGLMDKTKVRICDVANHVLFETVSEGGMVSWNLQGADGRRVKSGVYLVYGIDESGKSGCVSKVLVVD